MENKSNFWSGFALGALILLALVTGALAFAMFRYRAVLPRLFAVLESAESTAPTSSATKPTGTAQADPSQADSSAADPTQAPEPAKSPEEYLDDLSRTLQELNRRIEGYFVLDYDYEAMNEAALKAYIDAMNDPYSAYLTQAEYEKMMESSSGVYYGVGVQISQNLDTMETTITRIFRQSSGIQAGLKVYDILIAVNDTNVQQMAVADIAALVRGDDGSTVDLTVYRPSEDKQYTFTLERKQVEQDTVEYRMLTDKIGYILFSEFQEVSASQMREAIDALREQGMEKLVLDLRNNPGGLLSSLIEVADIFLPKKELVIYMEDRQGKTSKYYTENNVYFEGELAVLVNGYSASASEAFTGAMLDHGRATILGTKTFGKGIVQGFFLLEDGDAVKLTTQHYCTPAGNNIHGQGITPQIVLEDDLNTPDVDELLERALEELGK